MQFDELRFVCQQAASDLVRTRGRPITPTVVLPGPERTQLVALTQFPDTDEERHTVLAQLAEDHIVAESIPCWGFVAEADAGGDDVIVVVYGARRHQPHLTASRFSTEGDLEEFADSEPLDPTALPFLHPLQHAVDALSGTSDVFGAADPKRTHSHGPGDTPPTGGLPLHP